MGLKEKHEAQELLKNKAIRRSKLNEKREKDIQQALRDGRVTVVQRDGYDSDDGFVENDGYNNADEEYVD
jgi:hypothetical protein